MEVPGHDGPGVPPGAEVDGPGGGRREHVAVVAVAQAPRHALAPAAHGAVGEDRAGVLLAGVDVTALGRTDARRGLLSRGDGDEGAEEADQDDPEHGQPHPPDEGLGHLGSSYHSGTGHVTIHGKASRIGLKRTAAAPPYALQSAAVPEPLVIRPAEPGDAAAIGAIYDEAADGGLATFATGPHPAEERRAWLAARGRRAPVWVGVMRRRGGGVVGARPLLPPQWYSGVAEYTVYVAARRQGRGVGGRMLEALVRDAPAFGYWKLVGMILPENAAGLALARGSGVPRGRDPPRPRPAEGRWRDVAIVELHLEVDAHGRAPPGGLPESGEASARDKVRLMAKARTRRDTPPRPRDRTDAGACSSRCGSSGASRSARPRST